MEKIMFFGLAMLFEIMTAIPPQPRFRPHEAVPASGQKNVETTSGNIPNTSYDNADSKPVRISYQAEFWHRPE
jgi:hypothetical protein